MNSKVIYLLILFFLGIAFVFQMSVIKAENLKDKLKVRIIQQTRAGN